MDNIAFTHKCPLTALEFPNISSLSALKTPFQLVKLAFYISKIWIIVYFVVRFFRNFLY